ncbi:glyoxalase [Rhodocytophaga rosea]|uniref:Glyoxalase n=1 Tax=Rhodocytophaga rosea TaxID=2704465 RepID=A0A6C0GVH2_9BACT|nr:glyoxalase [Rhodocytophaga rosea]QHT71553.1 glyoxalase [Rhodocytophaga rosea]
MSRDSQLLNVRPTLHIDSESALPEEQFQNQTLRPILKLQNDLLLVIFESFLAEKSIHFERLTAFQQRVSIENAIKKDLPVRHTLIGCIMGLLTKAEYETFLANRLAYNKRLTALIISRLTDQLVKAQ